VSETAHDHLPAFRAQLEALATDLQLALTGVGEREGTVHLDQAAVGRVSRIDAIQQQKMAQAERRRAEVRLLQVRRALARIDDDTYGECLRCGDDIALGRLRARPEAPFCVACASELGA